MEGLFIMVGIKHVNMEKKIYEVLRKHKLPLKKREDLMVDLCDLYNVSVSFLYDFVNEFTDTEIPKEAIKESLDKLNER
jgi:hypothetical protein